MQVLCIDDDLHFCQTIENEAKVIGIPITFAFSMEQAKQAMRDQPFSACVLNAKYFHDLRMNQSVFSLIYQDLPSVAKLKELKSVQSCFVGGKPMGSQEAHYLLSKLCSISNKLESSCDWIDEIPEHLMNEYYRLTYERLNSMADLIPKIKKNPSTQNWKDLLSIVHKIAGSAGMYGHPLGSEICQKMEIRLKNQEYSNLDLDSFYRQLYLYLQ